MARFILFLVITFSTLSAAVLLSDDTNSANAISMDDQFIDDSEKTFGKIDYYFENRYELNENDVQSFEEYISRYKSKGNTGEEKKIYDLVVNIILDAKDSYEASQHKDTYALRDALEMYLTHRQELKGYISPDANDLDTGDGNSAKQDTQEDDDTVTNDKEDTVAEDKGSVNDSSSNHSSEKLSNEELLYHAISDNDINRVEKLIHKDVNVNADIKDTRPLIAAIGGVHLKIAEMLLEAGADPNLTSAAVSYSPLEAALASFPEGEVLTEDDAYQLVSLLLENGADPNTIFVNGSSALDAATDKKFTSVVDLLESYGATDKGEDRDNNKVASTNLGGVGDKAPDFQLEQINKNNDSETIHLSDLEGKGVVLNFWATYSEPSEAEMPYMQKLYKEYQDKGIEIVGVNIDADEQVVHRFIDKYDLTFPITRDKSSKVMDLYKIVPIPSTFFINPDGKIEEIVEGALTLEKLEQHFKQIQPQ
ncbi:thiol-disulfide oxidoreductase ResA [Lentibacillus sp. N15]|uniref:thiol-disulfide oxidoreductase ResA n=1 Tax=Lentibacillus songyuanensis TaxID=3136161 RepID=UPI0031BBADD1